MHVGVLAQGFEWNGGLDFLRNVTAALLCLKVKVSLIVSRNGYADSVIDFFSCFNDDACFELISAKTDDCGILNQINELNVDIIMPVNGVLGENFKIPWVGYLYDFQHKYFHQNFTEGECFSREFNFLNRLSKSKSLIVNSRSVKSDVYNFYPWLDSRIVFDLPFSPSIPQEWIEDDINVLDRYSIPAKYFIISNQFWIHKDHITAFQAVNEIVKSGIDINLVCTGTMNDYRCPDYINQLLNYVKTNSLDRSITLLGHIPKRDQIELIKNSVALLQPTRFEGGPGGGSVYDAVALGVPIIVSDIPVNREVLGANVHFFKCGDALDMKDKIVSFLNHSPNRPGKNELIENGIRNRHQLGKKLIEAALFSLNEKSR